LKEINPTELDLELATTKQIWQELQNRPEPFIVIFPKIRDINDDECECAGISVRASGIHQEAAKAILTITLKSFNNDGGWSGKFIVDD